MGKNKSRKGKSKASKAPGRIAHHVVVPGELYQTLKEHMEKTPAGVVTDQPPGQSLVQPAPEPSHLLDTTRLLIFSMVDLLDDLVNTGICLLKLKVDHIAILSDGRRKLVDASFIERSSLPSLKDFKDKVHENYHDLAVIIDRDVLDQLSYCAPAEVKHMLSLMKSNPWGMRHLINLHSAMVPMENRSTLYTRLYNYIIDILRVTDPLGFEYVMANLEYNPDWQQEIVHNKYLLKYYNRPGYEPRPQGSVAITLEEHQQMLRFNRNGPAHPLQDAADPSAEDGMLYNQSGVSHMYHAHFARVIYSLQVALQAIDKLKFVETRSLFCNSLKKYEEIE